MPKKKTGPLRQKATGPLRLLKRPEVEARTGLSCSVLYLKMQLGTFPQALKISGRSVAWVESEIDDWIASQPRAPRTRKASQEEADAA